MNRRSFFRVIGAVAAAAAVPTTLVEATQALPVGAVDIGLIREFAAYDIARDLWWVRYDVYTGTDQYCVTMGASEGQMASEEYRNSLRAQGKECLERYMARQGVSWRDLKPLPIPPGYKPPQWSTL